MKYLATVDKYEKNFSQEEKEFELRQDERNNRITTIREEINKWHQPQKVKITSCKKYR